MKTSSASTGAGTVDTNPVQLDEILLWKKIKKGNTVALGKIYELYVDTLFNYAAQFCKDKSIVMDCIHDVFVDIYKYRAKLADTDNVKNYLCCCLKRKLGKKSNKKTISFRNEHLFFLSVLPEKHVESCEHSIIRLETSSEKNKKLASAFGNLTKKQKQALSLKFDRNKDYEEIANIMEISMPTARTTIYRAIKSLRKQLCSFIFILILLLFS